MDERKISVALEGRMDSLSRTLQQAETETERHTRAMNSSFGRVDGGILSVGRSLGSLAASAGISGAAVSALAYGAIQASLAFEKLNLQFKATAGSGADAKRELDYVRDLSERLGLNFEGAATAYGKFLASTRNTAIEGAASRRVFEGVSEAVTALGLSADESSGILRALSQMMSKGKVSAEEMTQQLGEHLPGALQLAADGMGLTTAELLKQMQEGKVMSSDLLPKLAEQLHKTYGSAAAEAAQKGQANINRFNNEVRETAAVIGDRLMPAVNRAADALADLLKKYREAGGPGGLRNLVDPFIPDGFSGPGGVFEMPAAGQDTSLRARNQRMADRVKANQAMASTVDPQMSRVLADRQSRQEGVNADRAKKEMQGTGGKAKQEQKNYTEDSPGFMNWRREQEALEEENKWLKEQNKALDKAQAEQYAQSTTYLNPLGQLSDQQQSAFDVSSMLTTWEAKKAEQRRAELDSMKEFEAEAAAVRGDGSSGELLRIEQEADYWEEHWAKQTDSFDVYEQRMNMIAEMSAERRIQIKRNEELAKLRLSSDMLGAAAELMDAFMSQSRTKNKAAFRVYQLLKVGENEINTAGAITRALNDNDSGSWYERAAKAVIAGAIGTANTIRIMKATPEGGGSGGGNGVPSYSAGSYNSSGMVTQPNYNQPQQMGNTTIVFQGNVMDEQYVEERLVPLINSAGTRNVRIEYLNQ